ncbi:15-hydroxyprostaglandin dehydrogenase [Trichonephila clavipes]|nr:15-hydroxyprostaglandin dehydrogenase [Trichonephila clavipes]
MASTVLADPTRALQGTNRGSGPAMVESENDVGSFEQLLLYADEHYLAGKLPLGDNLGKVLHGVEEYHQRNIRHVSRLMYIKSAEARDPNLVMIWKFGDELQS